MRMLRAGRWITAIGLLLLAGVYVRALVYTPVERLQGLAQKIFYVHVPAAIWAESIGGPWWPGAARLRLTLFLFLLYVGYQLLRGAIAEPGARARFAAVLGICGMVLVPFIHFSVYMFG